MLELRFLKRSLQPAAGMITNNLKLFKLSRPAEEEVVPVETDDGLEDMFICQQM